MGGSGNLLLCCLGPDGGVQFLRDLKGAYFSMSFVGSLVQFETAEGLFGL